MSNIDYVRGVLDDNFQKMRSHLGQTELVAIMGDIVAKLPGNGMKIVSVIGGAASGKSTIAEELVAYLQGSGTDTDMLCTDNYAAGDRHFRQELLKDADAAERYNFELMDQHIGMIRGLGSEGRTVAVPVIDAETGIAADMDESDYPYRVGKVDVLIIEGDFPRDDYDIRFFLQVPDEQRLQNNIERETEHDEDVEAGKLTESFKDRQRTLHKPYTLPALQDADYVLEADVGHEDWQYTLYKHNGITA